MSDLLMDLFRYAYERGRMAGKREGDDYYAPLGNETVKLRELLRVAEEKVADWKRGSDAEAARVDELTAEVMKLRADLASMTAERDALHKTAAERGNIILNLNRKTYDLMMERSELRQELGALKIRLRERGDEIEELAKPCQCAAGPYTKGRPGMRDGREVLVCTNSGIYGVARAHAVLDTDHYAELRPVPKESL